MMNKRSNLFSTSSLILLIAIEAASLAPLPLFAEEEAKPKTAETAAKDGYTINYNTVSIIEYIKFASKICNANFIFNEEDLPFTVTVVSDAPITPENVMATLIQMLRIHGLQLLEQGNNLVVHKSGAVRQPATLVFGDEKAAANTPIVTRVFRLKNANVDSVAAIVRPMISDEALIEVSRDTRQLILTDATMIVEKIAALIENLDSPHTQLEIKNFEAKFNKPEYLIELASQIMNPIAQGNPFIMVPQSLANAIFIVSTPELNEKAVAVLTSLDTPPKKSVLAERKVRAENIFVVKLEHRPGGEILKSLQGIASNLQESGVMENDLIETIDSAKWIQETNSLMFVGSPESNVKIKEFINSLDAGSSLEGPKTSFFVYRPVHRSMEEIRKSMQEMADNLSKTKDADDSLIGAIRSQKANPLTHTLLYAGDPATFSRIKDLLATIDTPSAKGAKPPAKSNFIVYKLQSASFDQIETSLKSFSKSLENSGLPEDGIINTVNSVKYIKETNSLVFVGPDEALKRLQELLPQFDTGAGQQTIPPSTQFLAYKPKQLKGEQIVKSLKETTDSLKSTLADPALLHTLESVKWIKNTNTLLFTGDPASLKKTDDLIATIDHPAAGAKPGSEKTFTVVKLQYASRENTASYLNQLADHLNKTAEADLIDTIRSMKWIEPSHSFMFSGPQSSLNRIKELLAGFDLPDQKKTSAGYFIYPLQNPNGEAVVGDLKDILKNLQESGMNDSPLAKVFENMRYVKETNSLLLTGDGAAIDEAREMIAKYDHPRAPGPSNSTFFMYKPQFADASKIEKSFKDVGSNLQKAELSDPNLLAAISSMRYVETTRSFVFTGTPDAVSKIQSLAKEFDAPPASKPSGYALYPLKFAPQEKTNQFLAQIVDNLTKNNGDPALIEALKSKTWVPESRSFMFYGSDAALAKIKELLAGFDLPDQKKASAGYFIYKLQNPNGEAVEGDLKDMLKNLKASGMNDSPLAKVLENMRYVRETHSFLLTGDSAAIDEAREMIAKYDHPRAPAVQPGSEKTFYIAKLQYASRENTENYLNQLADHLNKSTEADLIDTIHSRKWIEPSRSFMFSGPQSSLNRVKDLLQQFDTPSSAAPSGYILYTLKYAAPEKADQFLNQIIDNLNKKGGDPALIEALKSKTWVPESHSYMFYGSDAALGKIRDLLAGFDLPEQKKPSAGYFIYKLQNSDGEAVEDDLENMLKNMKASGMKDTPLSKVLENMRYVKETNSLLLTGDSAAIEEAKEMIAKYDHPGVLGPSNSNFFMYKPQNVAASKIEKSLRDIGSSLQKAKLSDPNLLATIASMKYVDTTKSFVFTGTPDAIAKIQALVKEIDAAAPHAPIQVGKTTFLLYKLKSASGPQISASLKTIAQDLKKSGTTDTEFIKALDSLKYVRETHSLMFTGTEESLAKVQAVVEKFDVPSLAPPATVKVETAGGPTEFFVYKPQSLSGLELENTLREFGDNLRTSGLDDPALFNTLQTMKYNDKTQTLVFTGSAKSLDRVKQILKDFDVSPGLPDEGGKGEPTIQAIDNTSFLVYKLEFHKGDEIQSALRQIAKDLINTNAAVNQNLLNSINSIQWLEVTNSLLCSGDQETLTRLKELIKNLDIPLKQVFIEVLVIETSLTNALTFGLDWGGKIKYKDKFSGSLNNFNTDTSLTSGFAPNLEAISATTTPVPSKIPFADNFGMGVIGDIIKHNGQSFVSLGSLLNALQSDTETTIVMTPKIIAQDSKTATIFSGSNVPFAGSFVSVSGNNSVQTQNLEYRDIGMNLSITPVLGNSDIITLDINLDNSVQSTDSSGAVFTFSNGSASGITTSRTTMNTTVHIPNNHFLVLSGYVNNNNRRIKEGIPCLGGIPVIGAAFSKNHDTNTNTNIVIFMRPTIINSLEDMKNVSSGQEEFFRNQAGTPALEHNFDEAMEMIKSPEDD